MEDSKIQTFIDRWRASAWAERANYQLFLSELCDVLGVPRPDGATTDNTQNAYMFDRTVTFNHSDGSTSTGFIDLYKRGCFVLEVKNPGASSEAFIIAVALRATVRTDPRSEIAGYQQKRKQASGNSTSGDQNLCWRGSARAPTLPSSTLTYVFPLVTMTA
jgi:hypothetical protein